MKNLKIIFGVFILLIFTPYAFSATAAQPKAVASAPVEVELTKNFALADNKGTNVSQVYVFTAQNTRQNAKPDQQYIVIFYLDGEILEGFRDQTLPVSIKKNFKGLRTGKHEIRVDVEDNSNNGAVLSSQTTTINIER